MFLKIHFCHVHHAARAVKYTSRVTSARQLSAQQAAVKDLHKQSFGDADALIPLFVRDVNL